MRTTQARRRRPAQSEMLESRQLLSATLSASSSIMVFNAVENVTSQVETLTLTNTGDTTLSLSGVSVVADPSQSVDASARFAVTNSGSLPSTLAAGATFGLTLDYVPTAKGLDYALLDIASSDPATPTTAVKLRGIGTDGNGGVHQPSLMRILQAYDLPNYNAVGETDPTSAYYPEPPASNSTEVDLQQMVKAGPGDVTFTILASFTGDATTPLKIGWYQPGNPAGSMVELFHTVESDYQSVYVQPVGNTSFDPGSDVFGLYNPSQTVHDTSGNLITDYTQDVLNTNDTTDPRKFRFFPYIQPDGTAVPNAYIMTATEWPAPIGYDFTNIVAIITNVKEAAPVATADAASARAGQATAVNVLSNDTATAGVLNDASVMITTAPASGATVTVDPATGLLTYTAPATFTGTDTFAYTVANSAGYTSSPTTVTMAVTGPGGIVTAPVTTTAVAGVAQTINVLSVDSDTSGTLSASSVTITTAPTNGGTATVNPDGSIAYTPAAGFAGAETFAYAVSDSAGATSNPTTVTVTVSNPAAAPVAGTVTATTVVNTATTIDVKPSVASTVGLDLSTLALAEQPTDGGTATVNTDGTISYTPASNYVGTVNLAYTIHDANGNASGVGEIDVQVGANVGSEAGDYRTLVFAQNFELSPTLQLVTLTLNRGTALVTFGAGSGTLTVDKAGRASVSGSMNVIAGVALRNTTASSTLSMTSPKFSGGQAPYIYDITDAAPLGRIAATTTLLAGTSNLASVNTVQVAGAQNATLTIGSAAASVASLSLGTVTNSALTSAVPVKALKATAWTNAGAAAITAPSIGTLNVTGAFDSTLTLSSTGPALNTATLGGAIGGGSAWTIGGSVRSLTAGSVAPAAQFTIGGALTTFTVKAGGFGSALSAASIGTAQVKGDLTGTLTASSAKTIRVTGSLTGATLLFTGSGTSLNTLAITGAITASTLTTGGNVGTLSAASIAGSTLQIGDTPGSSFGTVVTAALGSATLNTLKLTARTGPSFSSTNLIAHAIGTASIGAVATGNGGAPYGIAVATAKQVSGSANGTAFRLNHLTATQTFGDFQIKVPTA